MDHHNPDESCFQILFPYDCREVQKEFLELAACSQMIGRHMVWEGPTGTGKTVCALASTLGKGNKSTRVLYLTRTNSQQDQVLRETRAISGRRPVRACGIQGRKKWCPLVSLESSFSEGSPEELSRLCGRKKRLVLDGKNGGCPYFAEFRNMDRGWFLRWMEDIPGSEEYSRRLADAGVCPYEAAKEYLPLADIITAPYIYYFNPGVRATLMDNMRCTDKSLVLVVDEAHNLPDHIREMSSLKMNMSSIGRALSEADEYGDPVLCRELRVSDFCRAVESAVSSLVEEHCTQEEDALVPCSDFPAELMTEMRCTSTVLRGAASAILALGERIQGDRLERGKLPRSYLHNLGVFVGMWDKVDGERYVHLALSKPPSLEAYCLDPSIIAGDAAALPWSLHMSGTLRPLEEYRDSMGLLGAALHVSPSPFPRENRRVIIVEDVTTRYEEWTHEDNRERMRVHMDSLIDLGLNTGFFFPSFSMLEQCALLCNVPENTFIEGRDMSQGVLMRSLEEYKREGGVFFGVSGGRLSEGIDFPGVMLEMVVLVGLPYPYPSARQRALLRYYDILMDRGWEYAMNAPMERKTLQAMGRLIRSEDDRGVVVILDSRARKMSHMLGEYSIGRDEKHVKREVLSFMGTKVN